MLAEPQADQPVAREVAHAEGKPHALPLGVWLVAYGALALAALLIFALNMRRGLNHDEHQFVASGALMAQGLRPWVDFPYFHLPTLAWLYAALFRGTDHLLLGARLLSIAAAAGFLALLLGVALRRLTRWGAWARLGLGGGVALLVLSTPAFVHAAGRAWNHDWAILLTLAAFLVQASACIHKPAGSLWRASSAGVLLGLAIGVRLSIAPLVVPFALAPLLWRIGWRRTLALDGALALGVAVGMLPVWIGFVSAPEAFLFGNLRYASLNTQWYAAQGVDVSLAAKLRDAAWFLVQPGNLLLLLLAVWQFARVRTVLRAERAPELLFWLLTLPFVLLGALAPTPLQMQYVYILIPFSVLGYLLALAHDTPARATLIGLGAAIVITFVLAIPNYAQGLQVLLQPAAWYPNKVHARGGFAAVLMEGDSDPDSWLYTLAPIFPLEGKIAIDPRTATGPFAWRVAPLLRADERARLHLLGPDELDDALAGNPARALLTGIHSDNESAMDGAAAQWAQTHDYVPVPMPDEGTLWLSPLATWETIRLGAQTFPTDVLAPGASVAATLYLQSSAPTAVNLNLLLRIVNQDGAELYRFDGWPFGSATSTWQPGALWQDGHAFTIATAAAPGVYRIEASFYDSATFETLGDVESIGWLIVENEVLVDAPALARLVGDENRVIDLLALTLATSSARPGDALDFTALWRTSAALARDYTVFAHLLDATGTLVAQTDRQPLDGFYPTSAWRAQRPVRDRFTLQLPPDLATGAYTLHLGMYDAQTQQRLPLAGGGDTYAAAVITVEP